MTDHLLAGIEDVVGIHGKNYIRVCFFDVALLLLLINGNSSPGGSCSVLCGCCLR